mgnify:FL=1
MGSPFGSCMFMVSVLVVIGMLVAWLVGFGFVTIGGLFDGAGSVVNVYVLFVHVFPSVAFMFHVYVVEYVSPVIVHVFVPLLVLFAVLVPMLGVVVIV